MEEQIEKQSRRYYSCMQKFEMAYEKYAKSEGLSAVALQILLMIYETENCTQKFLCEQCTLPKQTVNAVITAFYKKGWLELKETTEDRRAKTIHFTKTGLKTAEKIYSAVQKIEYKALSRLDNAQRENLISLTETYVANCCKEIQKLTNM